MTRLKVLVGFLLVPVASAQTIDGSNPNDIVNIARGYGSATLTKDTRGDPKISGKINGINYSIYFYGCNQGSKCNRLFFVSSWSKKGVTLSNVNEWNRTKIAGTAYLDSDSEPVFAMHVNLDRGVSYDNLDDTFDIWKTALEEFEGKYIGWN